MAYFTKIDNSIHDFIGKVDSKVLVLYLVILSRKREGEPFEVTNIELSRLGKIHKDYISDCLNVLEQNGLIVRDGKVITEVRHKTQSLPGNFTPIENEVLYSSISPVAKLLFLKLSSLKPNASGYAIVRQKRLTEQFCVDRTTLTRQIRVLVQTGLVEVYRGEGYKKVNMYKVKKVDVNLLTQEYQNRRKVKLDEKHQYLVRKLVSKHIFSFRELLDWFEALVNQKGQIYNKINRKNDEITIRNLLQKYDGYTIAMLIEKYVNTFDRNFRNYKRKTIKLHYLGQDEVFNRIKSIYDYEIERTREAEGDWVTGEIERF